MLGAFTLESFQSSLSVDTDFEFKTEFDFKSLSIESRGTPSVTTDLTLTENTSNFSFTTRGDNFFSEPTAFSESGTSVLTESNSTTLSSVVRTNTEFGMTSTDSMDVTFTASTSTAGWNQPSLQLESNLVQANSETVFSTSMEQTTISQELGSVGMFASSVTEFERTFSVEGPGFSWAQENRLVECNSMDAGMQSLSRTTELEIGNGWLAFGTTKTLSLDSQNSSVGIQQQLLTQSETFNMTMGPVKLNLEANKMTSMMYMSQPDTPLSTMSGKAMEFEQQANQWSLSLV